MNRNEIESLSGKELVATYNRLTGEDVKRFANHATGVKRVLAAYKAQGEKPAAKPAPKPESKPAPETQPAAAPKPAAAAPAVETPAPAAGNKAPRPGSKRAELLEALRGPAGITIEQMIERFGWKKQDCADALRLLKVKNGAAVVRGEDGVLRA
ncbi:MAG TPA: hypothetical protein VF624_05495 [Tepidisphaeraceae bacterium]